MTKHPKGKGCWYMIYIYYCPLCGKDDTYRERQWGPKPKDPSERIHYTEVWDYCDAL